MSEPTTTGIPYTQPDPSLAPGTTHHGFTVCSVEPLPELGGTGYVMRHEASGARLLWIAVPDDNKSFAIAFKTPPADDTGVFHILEHSVLCGSDRFPVKEPFVNLLKTSMQTFLNALTFPDKTMYPVASTNAQDLENLMDVYLDAVLHPAIYHRPRIFEQEGWHLELPQGKEGPLALNGVVLNEMRGALSDPDEVLYLALRRSLFPDTPYGFESGGTPAAIPTLTYDQFLDTHARHYNLANSYTVLYGSLDVERELAFVDERFRGAAARPVGPANPLPLQAPVRPAPVTVRMDTTPENASVGLAYVIGTAADRERILAADVLLDTLAGSNEAPLKRAVLESGLGDDFTATLVDGELQPQVVFTLKGAKPGVADQFRQLVEGTCARLADQGIERARLTASLAQAEFNLREADWSGYADGVVLSMLALQSWLYDDDRPVDYLRFEEPLAHMRQGLGAGYFEDVLRSLVCDSAHCAQAELVADAHAPSEDAPEALDRRKAALSDADLDGIEAEVAALRAEQEAPDTPEALATLPRLTVADIGEAPAEVAPARVDAPLPCVWHNLPTRGIDYVYHYFDLRRLTWDDLPYAGLLAELLGNLDTQHFSAADLDTVCEEHLGGLDFSLSTTSWQGSLDDARPYLVVGASCLSENVAWAASLPSEVWGTTRFDDYDRMYALLTQRRIALAQVFQASGHSAAMARLATHYSAASQVADAYSGIDHYLFLRDLLAHWEERREALAARLADLARRIFTQGEVTVTFTGPEADLRAFWERGGTLGLPEDFLAVPQALVVPARQERDEAFVIPSDVCYVAEGAGPTRADGPSLGAWSVAGRPLSFGYLWNEVRVKGGAYGVGFRHTTDGLPVLWSYRDPGIDPTVDRFEGAGDWLASWQADPDELDGYIVSCVASHDSPLKPRALAVRQDSLMLSGRDAGWREGIRSQILATTEDDVRACAPDLMALAAGKTLVAFGPREALEASSCLEGVTPVDLSQDAVQA